MSTPGAKRPRELVRALGVSHATAIVVGTIIGSGIFLVPAEMMRAVGSAKLVYLAWIVGALLSFFGALTYAELGAMKPEAGGDYVYVRDGYGPLAGFLYAWTWFLVAKPASIASVTAGIVRVLGSFDALHGMGSPVLVLPHFMVTYGQLVAIAATLLISALNYIGVRKAGDFQLFFTVLKVMLVLAIVGFGSSYTAGAWAHFGTSYAGAQGGFTGFMVALIAALWAYDGWNDLNQVAGEVKEPQRSLPIALIAGVGIVAVLYILMNAAVQYVMPAVAVAGSQRPASDVMLFALGATGAAVVSAGMALSMLVTLNGTVMSGARIPFAAARDGYFFAALADVHPRFRTPSTSIIVQAAISIILLLVAGTFQQLFSLAIFAEWLFYMIATSTVFAFRRRAPDAPRPYRTWGYPLVPALFIAASAVLLYYSFAENLHDSIGGVAVILAGIPVFFWIRKKNGGAMDRTSVSDPR